MRERAAGGLEGVGDRRGKSEVEGALLSLPGAPQLSMAVGNWYIFDDYLSPMRVPRRACRGEDVRIIVQREGGDINVAESFMEC